MQTYERENIRRAAALFRLPCLASIVSTVYTGPRQNTKNRKKYFSRLDNRSYKRRQERKKPITNCKPGLKKH